MRPIPRQSLWVALLAVGTFVVLFLMYFPILRVHQGWEDEIFWFSTCLSLVQHKRPVPSVLEDFSGTHSPLRFYGPTLFWLGALVLKIFGATMRSWRTYSFAGNLAFVAAVGVLFRRLQRSWSVTFLAVFVFSLSLGASFTFSLPGRPDGWTLALIVFAIAVAAGEAIEPPQTTASFLLRWLSFGVLIGVAASTTPRCWPLLFFLFGLLPWLVEKYRWRALAIAAAAALVAFALLLAPSRSTPWEHIAYVRAASRNDPINISPLLGGAWGFGHSTTQIVYYSIVLVILALIFLPRWTGQIRFTRWLVCAGLLNLVVSLLLVSRALNMPTYWAFPLEIAALLGLTLSVQGRSGHYARVLAVMLLCYMVALRAVRELPVFVHWQQRDPALAARAIAASIPPGSLVYGPIGRYFYPSLQDNADYRYLTEQTTPGLASIPGRIDTRTAMRDACHRAAYLVWPTGESEDPLPQLPHARLERIAEHPTAFERTGHLERMVEAMPGGRSDIDDQSFAIYRLQMNPEYCFPAPVSPN